MSDPAAEDSGKRELFNTVELGLDARQFLESKLGRHVAQRAQDEMYAAFQEFAAADPFDGKAMAELQIRNKVAAAALSWLGQAVEAGIQAEFQLLASENTD